MEKPLPAIPAKRYFTIGEVSDLCGVKPYVLRYWEQEFTQLKPMKRRGNRRYYQHHEVLLIRRIRDLLYEQGFTISGARNQLGELLIGGMRGELQPDGLKIDADDPEPTESGESSSESDALAAFAAEAPIPVPEVLEYASSAMRAELLLIRDLLTV
jgi:DNA-binding transcriptional MerR regulator